MSGEEKEDTRVRAERTLNYVLQRIKDHCTDHVYHSASTMLLEFTTVAREIYFKGIISMNQYVTLCDKGKKIREFIETNRQEHLKSVNTIEGNPT